MLMKGRCRNSSKRRVRSFSRRSLMRQRLNLERFKTSVWSRKERSYSKSKLKRRRKNYALRANLRSLRLRKADGDAEP
jgi:hypothetical protein